MDKGELVAIIGGGISGLSAAYELQHRQVPFLLFEQSDRLGGVIRTDVVAGFTIDAGPDSFLVQKPAAIALCEELGLGKRLVKTLEPRTAYIFRDGRLCPLPKNSVLGIPTRFGSLASSPLLSVAGKIRMAMELTTTASASDDDESVGSFFRRRFGEESVTYIAEPLLAGIHAGDVDRLSMRALFPRLVNAEREHGSLIRRFRSHGTVAPPATGGLFRSLSGGIGELTGAVVRALDSANLQTGQGVDRIVGPAPFTLYLGSGKTVTANQVIVATPAYVTAQLVAKLDGKLEELCRSVPYTSTATVVLSYPEASVGRSLDGTGFVVPRVERQLSLMAGSWVSSKWPGRVPEGKVLLRAFVGGSRDPHVLEQTDAALIGACHHDFRDLLHIKSDPVLTRVYRWPRLNPQHEVGHLQKIAAIDNRLKCLPGLHLTGAGFRGVGIPDCVENGRAAGAAAAQALTT